VTLTTATATIRATRRHRVASRVALRLLADPIPTGELTFIFDATSPEVIAWAELHAAEMITIVGQKTKSKVRRLVAQMFNEGIAPVPAAAEIRKLVPLHPNQRAAVRALSKQLKDPKNFGKRITRFAPRPGVRELPGFRVRIPKRGLSAAAHARRVEQYRQLQLGWRARNIARTESIRAANEGQRQMWSQAQANGQISVDAKKEWSAAVGDQRTCPICEDLDGEQVPIDGDFSLGIDGPPAHPSCRCSTALVTPRSPTR
jgi:SPP1 gp7 family putative phage head morphogenesis protein